MFNRHRQIFLAQRRGMHVEHGWQMPQGGIDKGEDPQAAAFRELAEETSIPQDQVILLGEIEAWLSYDFDAAAKARGKMADRYKGQAQRWFAFELKGPDSLINLETKTPEFSQWIWTDFETALHRIVPFKREVYGAVAHGFSALATP